MESRIWTDGCSFASLRVLKYISQSVASIPEYQMTRAAGAYERSIHSDKVVRENVLIVREETVALAV